MTAKVTTLLALLFSLTALALEPKSVVGAWTLDEPKSAAAADGNTAGLMKLLTIKADGTFEAMFGTQGTWKVNGGKLLVTYQNSFRHDEPAALEGDWLKFPSPAMAGRFCYLKRK